MFKKELSNQLLKIINDKNLTVSSLASLSHISREYLTNVISEKHSISIDVLENLCSALETSPDELLLSEKSKSPEKSKAMQVNTILSDEATYYPLCPDCNKPLIKEYQAFCDNCGQRLSWKEYVYANEIQNKGTEKNAGFNGKN